MGKIIRLFENLLVRRHYGECQRCGRKDYLPWSTEHGVRFCGHCSEKDALEYARLAGWSPPRTDSSLPQEPKP